MSKRADRCIFCEREEKLHGEHIFSRWISDILGRPNVTHQRAMIQGARNNPNMRAIRENKKHSGGVISIKLRVVCQNNCNGGWMSALETRVKPILSPLIVGQPNVLNEERQKTLARWIAVKIMAAEFEKPELACSTQADRTFVMRNDCPPPNWQIFIGDHRSLKWRTAYSRNSVTLWVGEVPPFPINTPQPHNTQMVTIGIGCVLIHVLSTNADNLKIDAGAFSKRVTHQIWPYKRGVLWPSLPVLSERDADSIDQSMQGAFGAPGFKWISSPPLR